MKRIISVITLSVVCVLLSFLLGRYSVKCEPCFTPVIQTRVRYIERKQIINNLENEINKVNVPLDRAKRDSLRAIYNAR